MLLSSFPPSASPSVPRKGRAVTAVAVAAAVAGLASAPPCAHAVGGRIRGGPDVSDHATQRYGLGGHSLGGHDRQLIAGDEAPLGEPSEREERTLVDDAEVLIAPFKINLLATNFPYAMKYNRENEISVAVELFLARYLDEAFDEHVLTLGVDCRKSKQKVGPETRWVLECEGVATFDENPDKKDFNDAMNGAFLGESEHEFLEIMYSKYELVHEMQEWAFEARRRQGVKNGQNKKKKNPSKDRPNKKKPNKNKPSKKNKPNKNKPGKNSSMQQNKQALKKPKTKKPKKTKPNQKKQNKKKLKKDKPRKNKLGNKPDTSSSIDIHNVNGSGLNVMGYVSGSQSKPGNGYIEGGGRRDRE